MCEMGKQWKTMENISQTIWTKHGVIQIWSCGFRSSLVDLLKTLPYICDWHFLKCEVLSTLSMLSLPSGKCKSDASLKIDRVSWISRPCLEPDTGYLSGESRCGLLPSNLDTRLKNKWQDSPQGRHGTYPFSKATSTQIAPGLKPTMRPLSQISCLGEHGTCCTGVSPLQLMNAVANAKSISYFRMIRIWDT